MNYWPDSKCEENSFYLYDIDLAKSEITEILKSKPDFLKIFFATKANPLSSFLKLFNELGINIDVASSGELHQATKCGFDSSKIITTGPAKSKPYLKKFLESGVKIFVIESPQQLIELNELSANYQNIEVLLRVQLEWKEGESVLGGNNITPFGISMDDWKKINFSNFNNIKIIGLHTFQWGNILKKKELFNIWEEAIKKLVTFSKNMNIKLDVIDLGGGLGVPYHNQECDYGINEVYSNLKILKEKYNLKKIWVEWGRFLTGKYGYFFSKIIDIKQVRAKEIIVIDGGLNHFARAALTDEYFPCNSKNEGNRKYSIHGPLCTGLDYHGTFELDENLKVGDWLCFSNTGAYGFTESMPYFLCHQTAAEKIIQNSKIITVRKSVEASEYLV